MLLEKKNAVIYGAGGAIGGAIARAFAREGAKVFLAGRTRASVDAVAEEISAAGGAVETAVVDALDEQAVETYADAVVKKAGGISESRSSLLCSPGLEASTPPRRSATGSPRRWVSPPPSPSWEPSLAWCCPAGATRPSCEPQRRRLKPGSMNHTACRSNLRACKSQESAQGFSVFVFETRPCFVGFDCSAFPNEPIGNMTLWLKSRGLYDRKLTESSNVAAHPSSHTAQDRHSCSRHL
jgi:hypothetical protein